MGKTEKMERMARAKEACQTFWADVKAEREANETISMMTAFKHVRNENSEANRKYFEDELDVKFVEYLSIVDSEKEHIRYEAVAEMYCDKTAIMKVMLTDYTVLPISTNSSRRGGVMDEVLLLNYILSTLNGVQPSEERILAELNHPPVKRKKVMF